MKAPKPPRRTMLTHLTQLLQSVPSRVKFSRLKLNPNSKVPELWVQPPDRTTAEVYPLLGERYVVGRSRSQGCDIVVANPLVSQIHALLYRDPSHRWFLGLLARPRFTIRDEGSTNGIFRGKRRVRSLVLHHNTLFTLGPPDLEDVVRVQFKEPPTRWMQVLRYGLYGLSGVTLLVGVAVVWVWQQFSVYPLPNSVQGPVIVYARDGRTPLSPLPPNQQHVELKSLREFAPSLPQAVMASEDTRFYWHLGIDPIGILRALLANVRGGEIREGGSTLTQQLARNLLRDYVGTEDSASRKLREAAVALKLEMTYSKEDLLRLYLNQVYLGYGNYGFEDAARFYFDKPAQELTLSEAATLVGILPAPNAFNPVRDYQSAIEYRNRVINRMAEQGRISPQEAQQARRSRINLSPKARQTLASGIAPYYYAQVLTELGELLGKQVAQEGNFIVETGMDPQMQATAEATLRDEVASDGAPLGFDQGALISLDAASGSIRALVGGVDYQQSQFNRASQAQRQPGSTFKIFAYIAALEQGISPASRYACAPFNWGGQEFAGCRSGGGEMDLYTAVAQSENPVALRLAQQVGLERVVQTAQQMGIRSPLKVVPGLILGQSEVSLLEMTGAFGVLANSGIQRQPHTIQRVWDSSECAAPSNFTTCRLVYTADDETGTPVLKPATAATMTRLLQGVVQSGTGTAAALGWGEAGKTGTTNDGVDLWFIGYVPSRGLVTGVWLGNDQNQPTSGSSAVAAKLWGKYMRQVL
jgi:1A family penicillin-binding protein